MVKRKPMTKDQKKTIKEEIEKEIKKRLKKYIRDFGKIDVLYWLKIDEFNWNISRLYTYAFLGQLDKYKYKSWGKYISKLLNSYDQRPTTKTKNSRDNN